MAALVGDALDVKPGQWALHLEKAKRIIDSIHLDGSLTHIPVENDIELEEGQEGAYAYFKSSGIPHKISISTSATYPVLTFLHEVGHFLDHQAIADSGEFASVQNVLMENWREAVRASGAVKQIEVLLRKVLLLQYYPMEKYSLLLLTADMFVTC